MSKEYAFNVVQDIYDEGERDYIFLESIMGLVAYDEFDNSRSMSDVEIFSDAMKLIRFLLGSGDFRLFRAKVENDSISYEICELDVHELEKLMRDTANEIGSPNFFNYKFILRKTKKGAVAPEIPDDISKLWTRD